MAIVKLTEEQLQQVQVYAEQLNSWQNRSNYTLGKCGEIAFHNYGVNEKIFNNLYGNNLFDSILKKTDHADLGHDFIAQSRTNKLIKIFAQIKTTNSPRGNNIILSKKLYNNRLEYYNKIPQDIFVFIKKVNNLEYDIIGYITKDNALKCYTEDQPIQNCYSIHKYALTPIEELRKLL